MKKQQNKELSSENERLLVQQYSMFQTYIDRLGTQYLKLCVKRYQDDFLTDDEYLLYDTFDAIIHFIALCDEIIDKEKPFPGYCLEKVSRLKSYVDTLHEYYKKQ